VAAVPRDSVSTKDNKNINSNIQELIQISVGLEVFGCGNRVCILDYDIVGQAVT
jgi:hypothetical protein